MLHDLSEEPESVIGHAEAVSINVHVNRNPDTLVSMSENTQVKELLRHSRWKNTPNGKVHGNDTDYHFNEKENGKNPNNSIKLLVQLANSDASLILGSAHDPLRSTPTSLQRTGF
jgi:hypothetical protein